MHVNLDSRTCSRARAYLGNEAMSQSEDSRGPYGAGCGCLLSIAVAATIAFVGPIAVAGVLGLMGVKGNVNVFMNEVVMVCVAVALISPIATFLYWTTRRSGN